MIRLGQGAVAELGVHLVRRTLLLPLRAFESLDSAALLAALTEDIAILANALVGVPHLCINIPIVVACFAYAGWLSPAILAVRDRLRRDGDRGLRRDDGQRRQRPPPGPGVSGRRRRPLPHRDRRLPRAEAAPRPPRRPSSAESLEPDVAAARVETVRGADRLRGRRRLGPARVLRLHRLPALRPAPARDDRPAHPGLGRAGRPLPDDPARRHPDLGARSWAGRGPRCRRSRRCSRRSSARPRRSRAAGRRPHGGRRGRARSASRA